MLSITDPISENIDNCLLDSSIKNASPPIINKSLNFIFIFVNVNTAKNIIIVHKTSGCSAIVIGKCSFIFFVVFPCIVFTKYVYGVSPSGVNSPVNAHIIIITINHLTFLFFVIFILYGFCIDLLLFIFILLTLACNSSSSF